MSEIGKEINAQKGIFNNPKIQKNIREDLNIVRKPNFDQNQFETGIEPDGWYVSETGPFGVDGYMPFDILIDTDNMGDDTNRYIKVKNGAYIGKGGEQFYIDEPNSTDFTEKQNYDIEFTRDGLNTLKDYWYQAEIPVEDTTKTKVRWIYAKLETVYPFRVPQSLTLNITDPDGVATPLNPTNYDQIINMNGIVDGVDATQTDGTKQYFTWVIGSVICWKGKFFLRQLHHGNIQDYKEQVGIVADGYSIALNYDIVDSTDTTFPLDYNRYTTVNSGLEVPIGMDAVILSGSSYCDGIYEVEVRCTFSAGAAVDPFAGTLQLGICSQDDVGNITRKYKFPSLARIFDETSSYGDATNLPITLTCKHVLRWLGPNTYALSDDAEFDIKVHTDGNGYVGAYAYQNTGETIKVEDYEIIVKRIEIIPNDIST